MTVPDRVHLALDDDKSPPDPHLRTTRPVTRPVPGAMYFGRFLRSYFTPELAGFVPLSALLEPHPVRRSLLPKRLALFLRSVGDCCFGGLRSAAEYAIDFAAS